MDTKNLRAQLDKLNRDACAEEADITRTIEQLKALGIKHDQTLRIDDLQEHRDECRAKRERRSDELLAEIAMAKAE
jgi:hypothetical protein